MVYRIKLFSVLIYLLLLNHLNPFAQARLDSLLVDLHQYDDSVQPSHNKILALNALGTYYYDFKPDSAIYFAPSTPNTFAISWGSQAIVVVPCTSKASATLFNVIIVLSV